MKIIEANKQIEGIKKVIFNDLILSGSPSNNRVDLYYLSEKNGVVYIMEDKKDFINNKETYNPVGIIDLNKTEYSELSDYLKKLFHIYNLIFDWRKKGASPRILHKKLIYRSCLHGL